MEKIQYFYQIHACGILRIMIEHMHSLTTHAHVDLNRGAIVIFEEHNTPYLPGKTYGTKLDAVLGGAPGVHFPVYPNRAQIGCILPQDGLPLSAGHFEQKIEIGVDRTRPLAFACWKPDEQNDYGFRVLQLYYKNKSAQLYSLTMSWDQTQWNIHEEHLVNIDSLQAIAPDLVDSLSLLQSI